jgi:hypothetical protein
MCWDKSEDKAREAAHKYFRWSLTGWPVQAELPDTKAFEAASQYISPKTVAEKISCGPMGQNRYRDRVPQERAR